MKQHITLKSLKTGQKLHAIKLIRDLTGLDLKEAKDMCDSVEKGKRQIITLLDEDILLGETVEKFKEIGFTLSTNDEMSLNILSIAHDAVDAGDVELLETLLDAITLVSTRRSILR